MDRRIADDRDWVERSEYWSEKTAKNPLAGRKLRRDRRPIILSGHGVRLRVDRGTLLARNGFTHFPQEPEEYRCFPGDPDLPNRIVVVGASGSISFAVLTWLAEQRIPILHMNWQHEVTSFANSNFSADPKLVAAQRKQFANGSSQREFQHLIATKFQNCISTLKLFPKSPTNAEAIKYLKENAKLLSRKAILSNSELLGIEGLAAAKYFAVWRGTPLKWKLRRRDIIPPDWHHIGPRRSAISKSNRNARHPVNAMLNYAYAILQCEVKLQIVAEGRDPTIGLSHSTGKYRDALVLDRMEPLRPLIDSEILRIVDREAFTAADFTVSRGGYCRLNPELARLVLRAAMVLHG